MSTIYEQLGGQEPIAAVVDDFYVRVLADPELAGFFNGANMARLMGKQVEYFCAALGGEEQYISQSMNELQRGRVNGQHHFDAVAKHLTDALNTVGVPSEVVDAIIGTIAPLAGDIVAKT